MKTLVCAIFVITVLAFSAFGQNETCPTIKNGENGIASVTKISTDYLEDKSCKIGYFTGTISGVGYDTGESEAVLSITIELADGDRFKINISDDSLLECFSEAEKANWKSQVIKGARVSVGFYSCGAAGRRDLVLASIEFLPKANKVKRRNKKSNQF